MAFVHESLPFKNFVPKFGVWGWFCEAKSLININESHKTFHSRGATTFMSTPRIFLLSFSFFMDSRVT